MSGSALTVNGAARDVICVQGGYAGPVSVDTAFVQWVDFTSSLRMVVFFPDYAPDAPATAFPVNVDLTAASIESAVGGGHWQSLCDEAVVAGSTLRIDSFGVDPEALLADGSKNPFDWFNAFDGVIDLTLTGCTVPDWDVSAGEVHIAGELVWSTR